MQEVKMKSQAFELRTQRLGPLPLVNHYLDRLGLAELLERFVPTPDRRTRLPYHIGLGVVLRSILTEREPLYRLGEVVDTFAPEGFGLSEEQASQLSDDAIGRALDRLFDADRGSLLTEIVLAAVERFDLALDELHNDSTTVRFTGQYKEAKGRSLRGKKAPFITYGYSKDHRPDLKQLLFILTSTEDGGVPVQFRSESGNQNDSRTHEESWEVLCRVVGRRDFLYVADSKLCGAEAMEYIHARGGRFVTVMPRGRGEDKEFRAWIQDNEPAWEKVWDRPNPRRKGGPRDRWFVWKYHLPSREGWPVIWVYSPLLRHKQAESRRERIARAKQEFGDLAHHHLYGRPRKRTRAEVWKQVTSILEARRVSRYLKVTLDTVEQHSFRQERRGRPGPSTKYRRVTKKRWQITWQVDDEAIAYDHRSDGMYPLLSNDRSITPRQVLEAHKRQPVIENRFKQTKAVHEIAPVLLKNEGRIEALFFLYFVALLITALLERDLHRVMARKEIEELPLYPEERKTKRPTAEQVLRLFSLLQRHRLYDAEKEVEVFPPKLTELQTQVLALLGTPASVYR
jgi:transposase